METYGNGGWRHHVGLAEKFLASMDVDADVEDADPADETFSKHLDANRTFQNNQTNAHERDQYVRYSC